jgi:hypothetical protein
MAVTDYLSRQLTYLSGNLTETDRPDIATRYIGGQNRTNQPFISGYHQVIFDLPTALFSGATIETMNTWLQSTCEGFTPHSSNINFIDVNGVGQLGSSFPASRTINREFTLTFREYQKLPIMKIFRAWNGLFDPHLGITSFAGGEFIPSNYKGYMMVGILSPTASLTERKIEITDVEDVYLYEGIFPTLVPEDTATASDQATNDSIQESVTFKFDGAPLDSSTEGLTDLFINRLSEAAYGSTFDQLATMI